MQGLFFWKLKSIASDIFSECQEKIEHWEGENRKEDIGNEFVDGVYCFHVFNVVYYSENVQIFFSFLFIFIFPCKQTLCQALDSVIQKACQVVSRWFPATCGPEGPLSRWYSATYGFLLESEACHKAIFCANWHPLNWLMSFAFQHFIICPEDILFMSIV